MQESKRTLAFVGAALVSVGLAAGTYQAMKPTSLEQFSDVGEEFFPEFKDPNAATAMRVAAYNEDAARVDVFNVEFKDGLWRIPSHHNYPADGEERLAKTATSIIGITRDAIVSTSEEDFKRLGVLDPLDEKVTGTTGRGDRITLFDGDNVIADYIIGDKVEDQQNVYHVRKPGENRTYRATLNIDISTKFADWIEPDVLDIQRTNLREIVIDDYSIDETRGVLVPGEHSRLTRPDSTASWELNDLAADQKLKTSEVSSIISGLEDLQIVGVRPKPPGLSADLKGEGSAQLDTFGIIDLQSKGFFIADGSLVSNEGEVRVGTSEGALYVLRFGEVFTGSDVEIEVGQDSADENGADDAADSEDGASESAEAEDADGPDSAGASNKQSRYLFVTAQFDGSLIDGPGEKPVKPEKPESSAEEDSAEGDDQPEEKAEGDEGQETSDGEQAESEPSEDPADGNSEDEAYQQAIAQYESELKQWEADQKAYEEKLEQGRKRVAELNARFADWYYVISAESFDDIRVARSELIEPADPPEDSTEPESAQPAEAPSLPGSDSTNSDEASPRQPTTPADEPATEEPAADEPATDEPATEEPAADKPVTEEPVADPPSDGEADASDPPPTSDEATSPENEPESETSDAAEEESAP